MTNTTTEATEATEATISTIISSLGLVKNDLIKYEALGKTATIFESYGLSMDTIRTAFTEGNYEAAVVAVDKLMPKFKKAMVKKYNKLGATFVPFDSFAGTPDNPRIDADGSGLVDLIANEGLKEPCIIDQHSVIAQGHRRKNAITILRNVNPTAYDFWFSEGVPVDRRTLTKLQFIDLLCDHGSSEPLSNPFEIFASFKLLYNAGLSEAKCMERLRTAIDRVCPMGGSTLTRIQQRLNDIQDLAERMEAEKDDNVLSSLAGELRAKRAEYNTDWQAVRRGTAQYWAKIVRLPQEVENGFFFQCTGRERGDYIKVTQKAATELRAAFLKDIPNGGNIHNPGEEYLTVRQQYLPNGAGLEKAVKTEGKPKAMTHGQMMKGIDEGQVASKGMRSLTMMHAGFKDAVDLKEMDFSLLIMEHVRDNCPELWDTCIDTFTDRRKEKEAIATGTAGTALTADEELNGKIISQSEGTE